MTFPDIIPRLQPVMPKLRGTLSHNVPLAEGTSFKAGGPAQLLFVPKDEDDLAYFLERLPPEIPVTTLGYGSNVLIGDGGIPGVTVRLGKGFNKIDIADGVHILVGAGAANVKVARRAKDAGIRGLSFLSGIPGGIGGSLRMNSGGYGREIKDVLVSARAVDRRGQVHKLKNRDMGYSYRHCSVPEDYIFTQAMLEGEAGNVADIAREISDIKKQRRKNQPLEARSGGSTFKNPPRAWELISAAGCRGFQHGNAYVSEKHCNFLINAGGATARHIEELGETVRRRVRENCGIELEWEVRRLGVAAVPPELEAMSSARAEKAIGDKEMVNKFIEQRLSGPGGESLAEFINLIQSGEERGVESFVMLARAAKHDRALLRGFFDLYFPKLRQEAQREVAWIFCADALSR